MNFLAITEELYSSQIVQSSELLKGVCASTVGMYPEGKPLLPWAGYLAQEKGVIVGACAFKSPPVSGKVEIAYFTFPGHEGRGVATRMANHLIELAAQNGIARIRAQTLPEPSASTRILERLGFVLQGSVQHPEDGEVWEWQK